MLLTCQAGFEALLARELAERHGANHEETGPGWVRLAGPVDAPLTFAHLSLREPVELRGETYLSRGAAADACARFCRGLIDAVAPYVVGVKLQLAFFEALGSDGLRAYEEVRDYARAATLLVVADAKRGDIGSTARAYADAYLEPGDDQRLPVDALTVNLPAITRVQILVDGKEVDTLAGHVDLRHPLQKNLQWIRGKAGS